MDEIKQGLESFMWKGKKRINESGAYEQSEQRMIDMTQDELKTAYNHCKTMLYNADKNDPGRMLVLETISDQRDKCGAELFLRYVEQNNGFSRITLITSINEFLSNNKEVLKGIKPTLDIVFTNMPNDFNTIPIELVLDGCLDMLGAFSKKHITRAFILRQGVWLTPEEAKDLVDTDEIPGSKPRTKLELIRERLNIKDVEKLNINSKGLSFTELRAMMILRPNKKYRDLTTVQLQTLRNRLLFVLEENVRAHIASWEERMNQIEQVAKSKGYML